MDTTDNTMDEEFLRDSIDRLLAWEYVHGVYCAGKSLRPCRIAERLGVETKEAREMLERAMLKARLSDGA